MTNDGLQLLLMLLANTVLASSANVATVGLLVDLHSRGNAGLDSCGHLEPLGFQHIFAARWAAEVLNNQSTEGTLPPSRLPIGIRIFDTCSSRVVATRDTFYAVQEAVDMRPNRPFLGVIGIAEPAAAQETLEMLAAFSVPLVIASPQLAEAVSDDSTILSTSPDLKSLINSVISVAKQQLDASSVSLITSWSHAVQRMESGLHSAGLHLGRTLELHKRSPILGDLVRQFINKSEMNETVAIMLEPEEVHILAQELRAYRPDSETGNKLNRVRLIIASLRGLNKNVLKLAKHPLSGAYLVEAYVPHLPGLREKFLQQMQAAINKRSTDSMMLDYVEQTMQCHWKPLNDITIQRSNKSCYNMSYSELDSNLRIDPEVAYTVKAMSAFSAAWLMLTFEKQTSHSDSSLSTNGIAVVLETLKRLGSTRFHGGQLHRGPGGLAFGNNYLVSHLDFNGQITTVGWYPNDNGSLWDATESTNSKSGISEKFKTYNSDSSENGVFINKVSLTSTQAAVEPVIGAPNGVWAKALLASAALGVAATLLVLIYVLAKVCDGTLAGNHALGVILLCAIMVTYVLSAGHLLPASEQRCFARAMIPGLALVIVYSILGVKLMQLRSLVLLGLGGRLSILNQYVTLGLVILVQVVLTGQWYLSRGGEPIYHAGLCHLSRFDFMVLHSYIALLALLVLGYGLSVLHIRRNYLEARWITLAAGLSIPILAGWFSARFLLSESWFNDALTTCLALILLSTVLLITVYSPKLTTIITQGSHFNHKKIYASHGCGERGSIATVVTSLPTIYHPSCDHVTKNPIYEVAHGAYP